MIPQQWLTKTKKCKNPCIFLQYGITKHNLKSVEIFLWYSQNSYVFFLQYVDRFLLNGGETPIVAARIVKSRRNHLAKCQKSLNFDDGKYISSFTDIPTNKITMKQNGTSKNTSLTSINLLENFINHIQQHGKKQKMFDYTWFDAKN